MNKAELVEKIAKETGLSKKDTENVIKKFIEVVSKEMAKGNDVQLIGFGTFTTGKRAAREGRNPATGEIFPIEPYHRPMLKFPDKVYTKFKLMERNMDIDLNDIDDEEV